MKYFSMKNIKIKKLFTLTICFISLVFSEDPHREGLKEYSPSVWALINANVYTQPGDNIQDATILIRDGIIENVGKNIKIPQDATIKDLLGKTVYSGFIESWLEIPIDEEIKSHKGHWSEKVNASRNILDYYSPDYKKVNSLRELGFTIAHIVADSGIFQGETSLVLLDKKGTLLKSNLAQSIAFEVDGWGADSYPNSLLGVVALIRQTFIDADWYGRALDMSIENPKLNLIFNKNVDLESLNMSIQKVNPFIFKTKHEISALRSISISDEFSLNQWLLGSGYEYRRIAEIAKSNPFIILPLDFPITPNLSDPYHALRFTNSELKHWDMAPDNPAILLSNEILFAFTSHGLKIKEFRNNIKRVVERGFSESDALASLTTIPAEKMGKSYQIGRIKKGFLANLTIVDGNYFNGESTVHSVWVEGKEFPITPNYKISVEGDWDISIGENNYKMKLKNKKNILSGKLVKDSISYSISKINLQGRYIRWEVTLDSNKAPYQFTGYVLNSQMEGKEHKDNKSWKAIKRIEKIDIGISKKNEVASKYFVHYPEGAYGFDSYEPKIIDNIFIKNTTLWTSSDRGIIKEVDILFKNGKVEKIDYNLKPPRNSYIIDGKGKHITPGLIDCHSHSGLFAVNEGTQSITSEVRIRDVINSDDIAIYRELAGGLTMANLLHGSANAIGGQNAVIKLRWGSNPEKLLYENAMPGIKFALGENVKQSNWGDEYTERYPQTRMGVEQILRDAFTSANEYYDLHQDYRNNSKAWKKKLPPKVDLELEALVEILKGRRQIHCHSYRQDEILMLTRIAEDFDFTIGTFQHVLEGYKVADRLREHGANASTFSDWWAYKFEVLDAIPYNGAIMANLGVNVSFNSDSNELARRMNTEAAKGVKYGNLSEEEALKLVTINPAKQLNIDKWVGSLELGKDADFVVWSHSPLSTKAMCEQTWIDGRLYFSIKNDSDLRKRDANTRNELINKIISKKPVKDAGNWKHNEKKSESHHNCSGEL